MPHGALKSAGDALNQLAVESRTACPTTAGHEQDRKPRQGEAQDKSGQSDN